MHLCFCKLHVNCIVKASWTWRVKLVLFQHPFRLITSYFFPMSIMCSLEHERQMSFLRFLHWLGHGVAGQRLSGWAMVRDVHLNLFHILPGNMLCGFWFIFSTAAPFWSRYEGIPHLKTHLKPPFLGQVWVSSVRHYRVSRWWFLILRVCPCHMDISPQLSAAFEGIKL